MGSSKVQKDGKLLMDSGKYARYTPEQVEILERVYADCPKPSSSRRQQLIRDCPVLTNIGQKQLKVWFQNRRCREKQRKETCRLQTWNSKLNAMNQLLMEENERLQKQAAQLSIENQYLKQQLQLQHPQVDLNFRAVVPAANDTSSESVVTSGHHQHSPQHVSQDYSHLSLVAEKILNDFLDKASGGMVDGVPLPGMKPGPDSIGALALPHSGGRVAAQACGIINLGSLKIAEIIKDKRSWLHDCRKQDIIASFQTDRGSLVEIVHTQMYAPTPLATAYDFFTLRYTCLLDNGSLVVCEGSLTASQGLQETASLPGFIRAEMLPSGALIRSCDQGASMVMVVDDMNFKSNGVLEGLQPLYDTSVLLGWRVTHKVLSHLRGCASEKAEMGLVNIPVQAFSLRLVRGFNDAINCFADDGWLSVINDGTVTVHINHPSPADNCKPFIPGMTIRRGILCAKASLLLHNIPPSNLLNFLRERVGTWADFDAEVSLGQLSSVNMGENMFKKKATSVKVFPCISGQNEVLEIVRLQKSQIPRPDDPAEVDSFLLQLCSSMEDNSASSYAQLIFAPIDASMPDDIPLLSSGFRVMHLDACSESMSLSQTLDLASSLEDRSSAQRFQNKGLSETGSALIITFQYSYDLENRNIIALKAQQNVQAMIDLLRQAAIPPYLQTSSSLTTSSQSNIDPLTLVQQLSDSFRAHVGQELLSSSDGTPEGLLKSFWNLRHAIVCCAWKPLSEFIFANPAALEMLECKLSALTEMSLERMFNDGCRKTNYSQPPPFLQKEGYAHIPAGVCRSSKGRPVSFERATGWKVMNNDPNVQIAAFMFSNWSFATPQLQ